MNVHKAAKKIEKYHEEIHEQLIKPPYSSIKITFWGHGEGNIDFGEDNCFTFSESMEIYKWLGQVLGETK